MSGQIPRPIDEGIEQPRKVPLHFREALDKVRSFYEPLILRKILQQYFQYPINEADIIKRFFKKNIRRRVQRKRIAYHPQPDHQNKKRIFKIDSFSHFPDNLPF